MSFSRVMTIGYGQPFVNFMLHAGIVHVYSGILPAPYSRLCNMQTSKLSGLLNSFKINMKHFILLVQASRCAATDWTYYQRHFSRVLHSRISVDSRILDEQYILWSEQCYSDETIMSGMWNLQSARRSDGEMLLKWGFLRCFQQWVSLFTGD